MIRIKAFAGDRRGVTAVEFALIAPVLVLIYFALTQLTLAMAAERRATHTASAIADLVAQSDVVTAAELLDVMTIGPTIVEPFSGTGLKMRISSVTLDPNKTAMVTWSRATGMSARTRNSTDTEFDKTLAGVSAAGDSFILGEVEYDYTSTIAPIASLASWTFKRKFYLRPRRGGQVECTDCNT